MANLRAQSKLEYGKITADLLRGDVESGLYSKGNSEASVL